MDLCGIFSLTSVTQNPQKLEEKIGRRRVDIYGDNVVSEPVAGDGFRWRHDSLKAKLLSLMKWGSFDVKLV